ncbi:DUF4293 domain-containing protein [Olivibacter sp. SDN3]|uniref:DUF4293 domain-containing protein n=1 Tax=Olivibacter sp. SDN3 TaxID=2764720 RepID=UPI0016512094|nr:DUF4293 domain-containing protein [Olivibacter sp. SDN3]QNL47714.1 DUF4293 domain-containing protein [Olivibacter sp. SDN3]
MIQRIQTIWLFIASITILSLFLFPYVQFFDVNGIAMALKINGVLDSTGGQNQLNTSFSFILQTIATIVLGILPLVTIFNYKNRKKQVNLIMFTIILTILFSFWLFITASNAVHAVGRAITLSNIGIGALLVPLYIIFLLLAIKGIRKDNKLIKSAERLR